MAIDVDAIRKRLKDLQASTTGSKYKWRPEAGKNTVRIVPYLHNKDNPFIELYFHYNFGKKTFLSPFTHGEADPVLEFAEKLRETGDKKDWVLSKKLEPKLRVFAPIIVRGKEKEGVKFWGFGKEIYQELMAITIDPDYGDITDLRTGRDVVVTYKTPEEAKNTYGNISIRIKPNQTPATDDKEIAQLIMQEQPKVEELYQVATYDELKIALAKYLDPESNEEEEEPKAKQEKKKPAPVDDDDDDDDDTTVADEDDDDDEETNLPKSESKGPASKKVTDAFDDLFNK